jgi:hypothetical protein
MDRYVFTWGICIAWQQEINGFIRTNMKFYSVANGVKIDVYTEWSTCELNVNNFNHAVYKGFKTIDEAIYFLLSGNAYSSCKNIPLSNSWWLNLSILFLLIFNFPPFCLTGMYQDRKVGDHVCMCYGYRFCTFEWFWNCSDCVLFFVCFILWLFCTCFHVSECHKIIILCYFSRWTQTVSFNQIHYKMLFARLTLKAPISLNRIGYNALNTKACLLWNMKASTK